MERNALLRLLIVGGSALAIDEIYSDNAATAQHSQAASCGQRYLLPVVELHRRCVAAPAGAAAAAAARDEMAPPAAAPPAIPPPPAPLQPSANPPAAQPAQKQREEQRHIIRRETRARSRSCLLSVEMFQAGDITAHYRRDRQGVGLRRENDFVQLQIHHF